MAAVDGFNKANGGGKTSGPTDAEMDALVARYG